MTPLVARVLLGIGALAVAGFLAYGALLVYLRFFWTPEFPLFEKVSAAAAVVANAEIIAVVPERGGAIVAFGPAPDREPLHIPDRASLSAEVCKLPSDADVVVLLPQGDIGRALLELELVALSSPPFDFSCPTAARFYSVQPQSP